MKKRLTSMITSFVATSACLSYMAMAQGVDMMSQSSISETLKQVNLSSTMNAFGDQESIDNNTRIQTKKTFFAIGKEIQKHWAKPHSARHGMEAVLAFSCVPTGEAISISVVESSGNDEFDKSVLQAAQHASPYKVLAKVESKEFDENFKTFKLKFNPADYW